MNCYPQYIQTYPDPVRPTLSLEVELLAVPGLLLDFLDRVSTSECRDWRDFMSRDWCWLLAEDWGGNVTV